MKAEMIHTGNFSFETTIRNHTFVQDAQESAGGQNKGPTPKELLLAGIIGCAGMDVIGLLKKHKMTLSTFKASATAEARKEHPRIFSGVNVVFSASGSDIGANELKEAVHMSLTKYCGVTAMVSTVVPVRYSLDLNGTVIATGTADFGL